MTDFREPYKHNDHEGKYFPDQKTFEHGGSTAGNIGSALKNLMFLVVIAGAIYAYFNFSNYDTTTETDPGVNVTATGNSNLNITESLGIWLEDKKNLFNSIMEEIEVALNSSSSSDMDATEPNANTVSTEEVETTGETIGNINEFSILNSGNDVKIFGIVENVTSKTLGPIRVSVTLEKDSTKYYDGSSYNAFTLPGEKVPFEIYVKGWDGKGELFFYADSEPFYQNKIQDVQVSFGPGRWTKSNYTMTYKTNFINKTNSIIGFPQIIIVMRNKDGSIIGLERKYLATDKEDYKIPALKSFPVEVNVYFSKEIPFSTDVYFSYLPSQ